MKIIQTNFGLACRIGNKIYINRKIKKYPRLYQAFIKHEKAHSSSFTVKDIILDWRGGYIKKLKKDYYKFMITHPSSWTMFIPVWYYDDGLVVDPLMWFMWFLIIIWAGLLKWLI